MVEVVSEQLGQFTVTEKELITFDRGLLGFPGRHVMCLVQVNPASGFQLLQSCEQPDLAFVVVNPQLVVEDYDLTAVRNTSTLVGPKDPMAVACIVTVAPPPTATTVNMVAPLVINTDNRKGQQVVVADRRYRVRHAL